MEFGAKDHTFAICAYKESPFLRECIESLKKQTISTNIIITTSTDNDHIRNLAKEYQIPLFINHGAAGIANDWNFAYHHCKTRLITLAHQDDMYRPEYVKKMLEGVNGAKHPLIYFTDYNELREGRVVSGNKLLRIKRLMLLPLRIKAFHGNRFVRRRILSMGNPISCPSVTYIKDDLPAIVFIPGFKSNIDWQAWELLSKREGSFVYIPKPLMLHRIHEDSTTSELLEENGRVEEDLSVLYKFWPKSVAQLIEKWYQRSEKSNTL